MLGWGDLVEEGVIFGALWSLPLFIPLGVVVAAALSFVKPLAPFAQRLITVRSVWFWLLAVLLGWLAGLGETIATGVFPGICC